MTDNFITKDALLGAEELPFQDVDVPEWKCKVRIQGMDGKQASAFSRQMVRMGPDGKPKSLGLDNFMAKLLVMTIVDPATGQLMLDESDVEALGRKSARALKRLSDIAADLSGMSDGAVADAEKNSLTPAADSLTD